ncbi:RNase H domain protein [Xylaria venustula]|nr:RNase H domain protein [Xylaria venustula]
METSNGQERAERVFPTLFTAPGVTQKSVFQSTYRHGDFARYNHRWDHRMSVLFAYGACHRPYTPTAQAAWAVYGLPSPAINPTTISRRLENKGPSSNPEGQTTERAQIRALIAALRCRDWSREGIATAVVATSSPQMIRGATRCVEGWVNNNWLTDKGESVKNRDLWEMLLSEVENLNRQGVSVKFWRVRRALVGAPRYAAAAEAQQGQDIDEWEDEVPMAIAPDL